MPKLEKPLIGVIGGGAGGIFGALRAAERARAIGAPVGIHVFEESSRFLTKVRISGGGRCNVTHHQFDPRELATNYPRGQKELLSPFHQFQAKDTVDWFAKRGVKLHHEPDGRMFPVTNSSQTIIDCFLQEAEDLSVHLSTGRLVQNIEKDPIEGNFTLSFKEQNPIKVQKVLLATGSKPLGYQLAQSLGHQVTELAPSLFTFKIQSPLIEGLAGTSFESARLSLKIDGSKDFRQTGPLLITHWGLSGPALLKLSAWAAREMKKANYQAELRVNWLGVEKREALQNLIENLRKAKPHGFVSNSRPQGLTQRFWTRFLEFLEVPIDQKWNGLSQKMTQKIIDLLFSTRLIVKGKSRFKEEFVECGGVSLKEIHFKSMESKICPGLYFSGEVMDVDGITGGFNFQNAWTSAWIGGAHMIDQLYSK